MIELPAFDALALSLHHSPGVHAILVGSGLSRAAGIPTGWEITLKLISRLGALDSVTEHDDWSQWYRAKYGREPSYSEILDMLATKPAERRAILEGFIATGDEGEQRTPTRAHHAIAQLVALGAVRVVITTNFDRLIEAALRDAGIEPTVIASDDAVAGATPLVHSKCTVIKVHGDYLDTRIKNTDAELADYSPAMNGLLDQVFDNFGLLAVGWSGEWDAALRSAILRAPSRRYPFYWAARGPIGPLAQELLDQRGGRSFPITDADSFFVKLGETLEALKQASRPHPQSVEMALALARRYCRDDKFAMEWHEFVSIEAEKFRSFALGPDYPQSHWNATDENLRILIDAMISKVEILRKACLICTIWGTDAAIATIANCIQSLILSEKNRNGLVALLDLRNLAASVAFYWSVAGAIYSKRYDVVRKLFMLKASLNDKEVYVVEILPFIIYRDLNWHFLKDMERRHTPASDYFYNIFKDDSHRIIFDESRIEAVFDESELLIALDYARLRVLKMDEYSYFWMPYGRFIWKNDSNSLLRALERIEKTPDDDPLFKSGLIGGSPTAAAPTIAAVRDFQSRSRSQFW